MEISAIKKIISKGEVVHSQALVDASYSLTRDQKRILWLFLIDSEEHEKAGIIINQEKGILEFSLKSYSTLYNIDSKEAYRDVVQALKDFGKNEVVFYIDEESTEEEKATDIITWLGKQSYRPKRGAYTVYFNPYLVPHLQQMTNQVKPQFKELKKLQNPKHSRLYTKLIEKEGEGELELDVEWMIERFALPNSYKRFSNFRQRFLEPAVKNIQKLRGMEGLQLETISESRVTKGIRFKWDKEK